MYVEEIERAYKVGQHHEAQDRLGIYAKENMAADVNAKNLLLAQDLKNKYEGLNEKIAEVKSALKVLPKGLPPAGRAVWMSAAQQILEELSFDTLPRLETFAVFAHQHLREIEEKARPSQSAEEVLALAVSGWVLGNSSAEPDVKNARLLWSAREMVLEYQKTENTVLREKMLTNTVRNNNMSLDVLARVIKHLPPPYAFDKTKIGTAPLKLDIDIADSQGGTYYVQLPPDYDPLRAYPVLLALHGAREKADGLLGA